MHKISLTSVFIFLSVVLFAQITYSQNREAVKFVNSGKEAETTGNYTEAFFYYSMAVDLDNNYADAYYLRGSLYKKMKNYGKAKSDFSRAVQLNASENLAMELGDINYSLNSYEDAIKAYTLALQYNPAREDAYLFRANSYTSLNQYLKASKDYKKVLEINPSNEDASKRLDAISFYADEEAGKQKTNEQKSEIKKENQDPQITENTELVKKTEETKTEVKNEQPEVKVESTQEVVVKNEKTEQPQITESKTEVTKTEVTKTEVVKTEEPKKEPEVTKTEESKPGPESFILKGLAYFENKDYQSALDEYNKAVETDPSFYEAYYHRGRAYTELNEYNKAINEYTKTIELNSNHEKAYINRGYIYNELKQYDNAINDFSRGVEINPNASFGFYNMGIAYFNKGNKEEAVKNFQQAARLGDTDTQDWLRNNGYSW